MSILQPDFADHAKTADLVQTVGELTLDVLKSRVPALEQAHWLAPLLGEHAVRSLQRLWAHCQRERRWTFSLADDLPPARLASICRFTKDRGAPAQWFAILEQTGWIDVSEDRTSFTVHDFDEHNLRMCLNWKNGEATRDHYAQSRPPSGPPSPKAKTQPSKGQRNSQSTATNSSGPQPTDSQRTSQPTASEPANRQPANGHAEASGQPEGGGNKGSKGTSLDTPCSPPAGDGEVSPATPSGPEGALRDRVLRFFVGQPRWPRESGETRSWAKVLKAQPNRTLLELEVALLEAFYADWPDKPKQLDERWKRKMDAQTLFNQWAGQLDLARSWAQREGGVAVVVERERLRRLRLSEEKNRPPGPAEPPAFGGSLPDDSRP